MSDPSLTPLQNKVLSYITDNPGRTPHVIATRLGYKSKGAIAATLASLSQKGHLLCEDRNRIWLLSQLDKEISNGN